MDSEIENRLLSLLADTANDQQTHGIRECTLNIGGTQFHCGPVYDSAHELLEACKKALDTIQMDAEINMAGPAYPEVTEQIWQAIKKAEGET